MKNGIHLILWFILLFPFASNANTNTVAPLGMELGVATISQVQKTLGIKTKLNEAGINKYSNGKTLQGNGKGLEIDGLSEILFVFDKEDKLAGVLMVLPKGSRNENFHKMMKVLSSKYQLVEQKTPFVGDSYAQYRHGNSIVELEAPHMSFTMTLQYLTDSLASTFKTQSITEETENRKKQASQF